MVESAGKDLAPNLLKIFVGMLSLYPIGMLLWLDTGKMGLVWILLKMRTEPARDFT